MESFQPSSLPYMWEETNINRLSFELNAVCNSGEKDCQFKDTFWTSKKKGEARNFDVNRRSFYAMRRIGNGYQGQIDS